jgi:hypothetical protein
MSRVIVCHLMNLAESIGHIDSALASQLKDVMRDLENPFLYNDVFPVSLDSQAKPEDARDDDVEQAVAEDTRAPDYLQQLQENSPAAVILFAEMLQKVYDGQYDEGIVVLSDATRPEDLLTAGASELKQLGMDLKELTKASAVSSSVLGVGTSSQAPKPSLRELVPRTSEGGDPEAAASERQDIWKRSIAQRKKLASLYKAKHPKNAESYRGAFEKFPEAVRDFKGKPRQEHRVPGSRHGGIQAIGAVARSHQVAELATPAGTNAFGQTRLPHGLLVIVREQIGRQLFAARLILCLRHRFDQGTDIGNHRQTPCRVDRQ